MGLHIPQPGGIGADLVGQDDGAVGQTAKLQLEVHQGHAAGQPEGLQGFVDPEGVVLNGLDLLGGSQLQGQCMIGIQQRVAQRVVFIGELDGGMLEDQ